jgi:uncharacterized protein YbdZ (MbtH family)
VQSKEDLMPFGEDDDSRVYSVVVNDEEQYSIWPRERTLPKGWRGAGFEGVLSACLEHIERVWTDMRPLSLRRYLESQAHDTRPSAESREPNFPPENLVERLCRGEQSVKVGLRSTPDPRGVEAAVQRGHLHLEFTGTQGGTNVGIQIDPTQTTLDAAFLAGSGRARIVGSFVLDFVPLTCVAEIDGRTLSGVARVRRRDLVAARQATGLI